MFKKSSHINSQLIAISLVVVVGLHSLNSFSNTHSHRLENGTIVIHAHPYERGSDSSPFQTHQHAATELVFLASLMHFLPSAVLLHVGLIIIDREQTKHLLRLLSHQYFVGLPSPRGPPALSLGIY